MGSLLPCFILAAATFFTTDILHEMRAQLRLVEQMRTAVTSDALRIKAFCGAAEHRKCHVERRAQGWQNACDGRWKQNKFMSVWWRLKCPLPLRPGQTWEYLVRQN